MKNVHTFFYFGSLNMQLTESMNYFMSYTSHHIAAITEYQWLSSSYPPNLSKFLNLWNYVFITVYSMGWPLSARKIRSLSISEKLKMIWNNWQFLQGCFRYNWNNYVETTSQNKKNIINCILLMNPQYLMSKF